MQLNLSSTHTQQKEETAALTQIIPVSDNIMQTFLGTKWKQAP